jgi:3-hydroxymyristoyl/3-hydroxydecanoyl-(acyl carrier protein) dehydratase
MDRLFLLDDLEGQDDRFCCRALVPVATPLVEGHFPAEPLVPGIGILMLVVEVLALGLRRDIGLGAIEAVRFRSRVGPGSELLIEITAEAERARFRVVTAAGTLVADGRLRLRSGGGDG